MNIREYLRYLPPEVYEWLPRRTHSSAHWRRYESPNFKVYASLGGDIYALHVTIGRLSIAYESDELMRRHK